MNPPNMIRGRLPFFLKCGAVVGLIVLLVNHFAPSNTGPFNTLSHAISSKSATLAGQEIPKKVWQTWHTSAILLDEEERERARTWQEKNPHYRYELLTDHGAESYVRHHFADDPLIRDTFLNLTDKILRADFMRYLVLAAEGGVYADLDVVCQEPIDTWIPLAFQGKTGVVIGVENDRMPVENDASLYYDYRKYIWGINNWTFMCTARHPFMRFVAESVARNLLEMARKQYRTLATMKLSYKEVIESTGPGAFTNALFAYVSRATGKKITHKDATMLEEPKLIDDILILPIRAMSTAEAEREGVEGAHSKDWPAVVFHWSVGSWKSDHLQRPEDQAAAEAEANVEVEDSPAADDILAVDGAPAAEEVRAAEAVPAAEGFPSTGDNGAVEGDPALEAALLQDGAQAVEGDQVVELESPVEGNPPFAGNPPVEANLPVEGNPLLEGDSPVDGNPPIGGNSPIGGDPPVVADLPAQ
ncbi:hypothetical protein HO173_012314 [Letharia columbiana]|uniref:Initiation-specific alpha-1,6-mannosyltransferase n=1 Tax=Letharia columbiana TaxID=112416 RepID=A0A8H6CNT9_9LECA|nr:uncharacterized protein HO173_012314 [Letharia columbiana]KAF6226810.1 hypothetical protein HO173_012314 [Letharia columbiana]